MLRDLLRQEGTPAGRLHVATLMKRMGLEALYRRPNTSKPTPGHKIYPYLLRKLAVTRPNQVCAASMARCAVPFGATQPYSARWPRIALPSWVRCFTARSRVRNTSAAACCSSVFTATNRMLGRCAASQIASASTASFLWRFT